MITILISWKCVTHSTVLPYKVFHYQQRNHACIFVAYTLCNYDLLVKCVLSYLPTYQICHTMSAVSRTIHINLPINCFYKSAYTEMTHYDSERESTSWFEIFSFFKQGSKTAGFGKLFCPGRWWMSSHCRRVLIP